MTTIHTITIAPLLINTSCAWASEQQELEQLYLSPYTGAVTTRTACPGGFSQNDSHTVAFSTTSISSVNSYGYSPHPLLSYLTWIEKLLGIPPPLSSPNKPFIVSITASTASELEEMVATIQQLRLQSNAFASRIAIELNTSCPNIPGSPPKGYVLDSEPMFALLDVLSNAVKLDPSLTVGLKLPPYVYAEQFTRVVTLVKTRYENAFAFFTCTNTLGSSLLFTGEDFALPTPLGGLAGESLHTLSLGNVYSFRKAFDRAGLSRIQIIGAGGVTSKEAVGRMRKAGASVVGCATFLGKNGVDAFRLLSEQ